MSFTLAPMTEADARAILTWRYEEPYAIYNMEGEAALAELVDRRSPHFAVRDETGALAGFFGFGTAAEVGEEPREPALFAAEGLLSVGLGLRPDLVGQGRGVGLAFVNAGLDFARAQLQPRVFRLFVLTFNARAIRVYERAGFSRVGVVHVHGEFGERAFLEMRRDA